MNKRIPVIEIIKAIFDELAEKPSPENNGAPLLFPMDLRSPVKSQVSKSLRIRFVLRIPNNIVFRDASLTLYDPCLPPIHPMNDVDGSPALMLLHAIEWHDWARMVRGEPEPPLKPGEKEGVKRENLVNIAYPRGLHFPAPPGFGYTWLGLSSYAACQVLRSTHP